MDLNPNDIEAYLSSLEYEHDIALLGAWDTGSHAWGLASPTSDYDITVAYVQSPAQSATRPTESIDTDGTALSTVGDRSDVDPALIELAGWNAGRFLELILDSNPAAIEALQSPLVYRGHPLFADLRGHISARFKILNLASHYRSMGKRNYRKYISGEKQDDQTIKRNLNVVRSCMYSEYIYETHTLPQLNFPAFLEDLPATIEDEWKIDRVWELVDEKRIGNGDTEIGNPFKQTVEEKVETLKVENRNPRNHVRDETLSADVIRDLMREIIQSRVLTA